MSATLLIWNIPDVPRAPTTHGEDHDGHTGGKIDAARKANVLPDAVGQATVLANPNVRADITADAPAETESRPNATRSALLAGGSTAGECNM